MTVSPAIRKFRGTELPKSHIRDFVGHGCPDRSKLLKTPFFWRRALRHGYQDCSLTL